MMSTFIVGQVIALRIRFNNSGMISANRHPYLIVDVGEDYLEIAQIDSLEGKRHKAFFKGNKVIKCHDPEETVIDKDSYIQMDNSIYIELYDDLVKFRRQRDTLSSEKLDDVIKAYDNYHINNVIDDDKIVYLTKEEIESLNN